MRTIEDMNREGWRFDYCRDTGFISATNPAGGAFSVCELRPQLHIDVHDLGNIMAHALNSWGAKKEMR